MHLSGLHTLDMSFCRQSMITDGALVPITGLHTLNMSRCGGLWAVNDHGRGAAFMHLTGPHTLNMSECTQLTITNGGFRYLSGLHELIISGHAMTHAKGI